MKKKIVLPITLSPAEALRKAVMHLEEVDGKLKITVDRQIDDVELLMMIVDLVRRMIRSPRRFDFQCEDFDLGGMGCVNIECRLLLKALVRPNLNLLALKKHHKFHPLLSIFVEAFQAHGLLGLDVDSFMYVKPRDCRVDFVKSGLKAAEELAKRLNYAVADVGKKACECGWRGLEKNFRRNANKNARGLILDLKKQLDAHARVLVIRLDLSFANGAGVELEPHESNKISIGDSCGLGSVYEKVRDLRVSFWKEVEKIYGDGLLGRASKLEYGYSRGYHFHALIFLDGSMHQKDIQNGIRIGEIWKRLVPDGAGTFYLCNAHKENYMYVGVGMATYADDEFFTGYVMAVAYLTKPDFHMQLVLPRRDRAFHASFAPKAPLKKLGRKRRKESAMDGPRKQLYSRLKTLLV